MAKTDATIHTAWVFLLPGPTERSPTRCHEDGRDGLAFVGDKLFAVHFDLEGITSFHSLFYSSVDHVSLSSFPLSSTLAVNLLSAYATKKEGVRARLQRLEDSIFGNVWNFLHEINPAFTRR
jgi:hypothetical protein